MDIQPSQQILSHGNILSNREGGGSPSSISTDVATSFPQQTSPKPLTAADPSSSSSAEKPVSKDDKNEKKNDGSDKYLWNMTAQDIRNWLHGSYPLFPRPKIPPKTSTAAAAAATADHGVANGDYLHSIEQRDTEQKQREEYARQFQISELLLQNLCRALQSASEAVKVAASDGHLKNDDGSSSHDHDLYHPNKRMKMEIPSSNNSTGTSATAVVPAASTTTNSLSSHQRDKYNILDPSFAQGDHILHQPGTILARLTIGGWINALSGRISGLVNVQTAKLLDSSMTHDATISLDSEVDSGSSNKITVGEIRKKAMGLSHVTSARLEVDMMQSTPQRIVEMLCPEVTTGEIVGIRKRIYDTVILGRGTNASANAAALESVEGLPVAARVGMHDIDKFKRCKVCGNNDQGAFVLDKKNGDLICTECGTVATESLMHEGTQFRKFEGEEDRNHHGDIANPLYSNAYNMGTSLSGVTMAVGAGIGGYGSGGRKGMETILKNIHNYTEMNISQFGKEEKKTRVGYKDRQKKVGMILCCELWCM
jgi:hypothetical protein